MSSGIRALETTYHFLFVGILIILGVMLFLCLLRACMGPTVADRLVSINMMGTMVMVIIATLAVMMGESYLVDICIIYAMISFLAVIVLSKVIMGDRKQEETEEVEPEKKQEEDIFDEMIEQESEEFHEKILQKEPDREMLKEAFDEKQENGEREEA